MTSPAYVIFFNDWPVYPTGINAGGGETATLALAKALSRRGKRVIACANLPNGDEKWEGIEFWSFGKEYNVDLLNERLDKIGPFHCLAASLVQPFISVRRVKQNLSRILINHSPSPIISGFEPYTTLELMDIMLCVSNAQRQYVLSRGMDPQKVVVVKNGFDPEIFTYSGPEGRDFKSLLYIGRVEAPKGIHVLLPAYGELIKKFPGLSLNVFGDMDYWPEMKSQKNSLEKDLPGLKFHGKAPQAVLSKYLKSSGVLIFPSISFESGTFAVIDAQASGCPAVAFSVGGVPEYIIDGKCGVLLRTHTPEALYGSLSDLMANPNKLVEMSRAGETFGRVRTWDVVASEIEKIAEDIIKNKNQEKNIIRQLKEIKNLNAEYVLNLHEELAKGKHISDEELKKILVNNPQDSNALFIQGLRAEAKADFKSAVIYFTDSAKNASLYDWQPFFKLTLLHADSGDKIGAQNAAEEVLRRSPDFPLRPHLEKLIAQCK